jgi:plastocyanin
MAKIVLDVTLVHGVNKQEFVDSFNSETEADWWNMLETVPCCICMEVEESFVETFKQDERVVVAEERLEAYPATLPSVLSTTKNVTASIPSTANNGGDYMPLQMYVDSDHIYPVNPGEKVGRNGTYDDTSSIPGATYSSRWTGKHVDIVTVEVGPISGTYAGNHDTHPDFDDPDNPGTSRVIPMDWNTYAASITEASNIQVTSNSLFSSHAMGVLSAAGGSICGFAKKASLRVIYMTGADGATEVIDAVTAWHSQKGNNPVTGVPNPTIMIGEFQYLNDRRYGIPVDYVSAINTPEGTVNRPVGGWGSDLSPFVDRNIIPFSVLNTNTSVYEWCVVMPNQFRSSSLKQTIDSAFDAGVVFINAAGNNGGVYYKEDEYQNYNLDVDGGSSAAITINLTTASQTGDYLVSGSDRTNTFSSSADPTITMYTGDTLVFDNSATSGGHPMYIRVSDGGASVSNPAAIGEGTATVSWTPSTAGTYYYQCSSHPLMIGTITVTDSPASVPYTMYSISYNNAVGVSSSSTLSWYPFSPYGPHGNVKAIDVAAGYNSEGIPALDGYTNRGPGIDIVGLGESTWTAYPSSTYGDGYRWGMFSGTSCATPTVVGKAACLMEREFYYTGSWPTPAQMKSLLRANGREKVVGIQSTTWNNVPVAGGYLSNATQGGLVRIFNGSGNGGYTLSELAGTTRIRAHFESTVETLDKSNLYKRRPDSGALYPRRKLRNNFSSPSVSDDLPSTT